MGIPHEKNILLSGEVRWGRCDLAKLMLDTLFKTNMHTHNPHT